MDISNKISYDTAGAVANINSLAAALRDYNKAVAGVSKAAKSTDKTAKSLDGVSKSAKKAADSSHNLAKSLSSAGSVKGLSAREKEIVKIGKSFEKARKNSKGLLISFESLARIGVMQVLHQAFSQVTSSIRASTAEARELGVAIAEIQTIGPQFGDFDKLTSDLKELSDLSGLKMPDVTAGMYQTLSNQVTEVGHSFEFLATSADLAIAGVSSLEGSVNLLSSIINSYGKSSADALEISDQLFKAVELGRFKIEDIADSYGRIAGLASQAGVGNDELLASLAALTSTGMDAAEGMTLVNNVMLKLIKPTTKLKAVFDQLGVASAEAGIQAFGYQGFLVKIMETTDGTATELGELYGRIRAVRGALGLSVTTAEKYNEILKELQDSAGATAKAKAKIFEAEGKQLSVELNAIHNATVALGESLNSVLLTMFDMSGGGVSALKAVAVGVAAVTVGVIALKRAFIQTALAAAVTPLGAALIAIGLIAAGISLAMDKAKRDTEEAANAMSNAFAEAEKKRTVAAVEESTKRRKAAEDTFSAIQRSLTEQVKAEKAAALETEALRSRLFTSLNSQLDKRVGSVDNYFNAIKDQAKAAMGAVADLRDVISGTTATLEDYDFDIKVSKKGLADTKKFNLLLSKSVELRNRSIAAARQGHADEAKALQQRSISYAKQAESQAKSLKSTSSLKRAQDNVRNSIKNQITLERTKAQLAVKAATVAEKDLKTNEAKFRQLEALKTKMAELSKEELSPELSSEARGKIKTELVSIANEIDSVLGSIKWTKAFDNLNFRDQAKMFDMFTELSSGMYNELTQQSTSWGDGVISMLDQIEAKFKTMASTSNTAVEALFGNVSATEASKLLLGLEKERKELDTLTKDAILNDSKIRESREKLSTASIKAIQNYSDAFETATRIEADSMAPNLGMAAEDIALSGKRVTDALAVINDALKTGKVDTDQFTMAVRILNTTIEQLPDDDFVGIGVGAMGEAKLALKDIVAGLDDVKVRVKLIPDLQKKIEKLSKIDAKIKIATEALDEAKKDAEELNKEVKNLEEKKEVNVSGVKLKDVKEKAILATKKVEKLTKTVSGLQDKKVDIKVDSNATSAVSRAQQALDSLQDKTVKVMFDQDSELLQQVQPPQQERISLGQYVHMSGELHSAIRDAQDYEARLDAIQANGDFLFPDQKQKLADLWAQAVKLEERDIRLTLDSNAQEVGIETQAILDGIQGKDVEITTDSDVKEKTTEATTDLEAVPNKGVKITTDSDVTEKVNVDKANLQSIPDKTVKVDADASEVKQLSNTIQSLTSKSVSIQAITSGTIGLLALQMAIAAISSKSVQVIAHVHGEAAARSLKASIDALHDKTITITTRYVTIGSKPAKFGRLFRASGGDVRGTDTVPAMLTPGEFVVNTDATKKMYSQLVAANSSSRYLGQSSSNSNTTNFNNNFNITGSDAPQQTAREITKLLRRENRIRK